MSVSIATERRMLTEAEFEVVKQTHYPSICGLSREDLTTTARRVRDYRDKARDTSRQQRREMRGKAEPRGARAARDNTGTSVKKTIFAGALKRLNQEIARLKQAERQEGEGERAQRTLQLRRENRTRHHPSAGRSLSID